jgi:hypothetical protein
MRSSSDSYSPTLEDTSPIKSPFPIRRSPSPIRGPYPKRKSPSLKKRFHQFNPIPEIRGITKVEIPIELKDEPYSYEPSGYKVEILVPRPRFLFDISKHEVNVYVGRDMVSSGGTKLKHNEDLPAKHISNVSVLTVYDTYGLDVTYAYLNYLYHNKFYERHPLWLSIYLMGSYVAMTDKYIEVEDATDAEVLMSISMILLELVQREAEKFKPLASEPASRNLPPELIARIIGSTRLSKDVSKQVMRNKCSSIPKPEDMLGWSDWPDTLAYHIEGWSRLDFRAIDDREVDTQLAFYLKRIVSSNRFILGIAETQDMEQERGERVAAVSLHSYYAYFKYIGCNWRQSLDLVISDLRKKIIPVTDDTLEDLCAWTIQLHSDIGYWPGEGDFLQAYREYRSSNKRISQEEEFSIDDLENRFIFLIDKCKNYDFSNTQ